MSLIAIKGLARPEQWIAVVSIDKGHYPQL